MDLCDLVERRCPPRKIPQYLSVPISTSVEEIAPLIDRTPKSYSKPLVKILVQLWENGQLQDQDQEEEQLAEWLYNKTIELLPHNDSRPQQDVITYAIAPTIRPKIPENPRILSNQGTTGHRTWEASVYLCQYLFRQKWLPQVKKILELGAGTGLVSTALALAGHQIISTDGDPNIIGQLEKTFQLNEVDAQAQILEWGLRKPPSSELVVAADVTYDTAVIPAFCHCLYECQTDALVACTIRNPETITFFQEYCSSIGLQISIVAFTDDDNQESSCMESITFEPLVSPIRIYRVSPSDVRTFSLALALIYRLSVLMALHNYVYLKHREHDQACHELLVREKDKVMPQKTKSLNTPAVTTATAGPEKVPTAMDSSAAK